MEQKTPDSQTRSPNTKSVKKKTREGDPQQSAKSREEDFEKKVVAQLQYIYRDAKKLVPVSKEDKTWKDTATDHLKSVAKIIGAAVTAGGMGALASYVVGKPDMAGRVAAGAGTVAALCALWSASNENEAREKAESFLALVKEQKAEGRQLEIAMKPEMDIAVTKIVDKRFKQIAKALCFRFRFAIQLLRNSEDGIEQLATFLTVAMARDVPTLPEIEQMRLGLLGESEVIDLAVRASIPASQDDPLYSGWFQNKTLETTDGSYKWTIPGLMLRSPVFLTKNGTFYVRDGTNENRADKYPPQVIQGERPARYMIAVPEALVSIGIFMDKHQQDLCELEGQTIKTMRFALSNDAVSQAKKDLEEQEALEQALKREEEARQEDERARLISDKPTEPPKPWWSCCACLFLYYKPPIEQPNVAKKPVEQISIHRLQIQGK